MPYTYDHPRPAVTVDTVILVPSNRGERVLLVRRGRDPFKGSWALPGGFLDIDEELERAAARELEEETGLEDIVLEQVGAFGRIGRDPRGRTVSVVYLARLDHLPATRAGSDAEEADWFPMESLPELAFDHAEILETVKKKR
jgi:8-oxo-dGTP diphosphatase